IIAAVLPGSAAAEMPFDGGDELCWRLAPSRPSDVNFARAPHAVPLQEHLEGAANRFSPPNVAQVAVKRFVRRSPQPIDRTRMGPDDIRNVSESEPHLGRHVAGRRPAEAREFRSIAEPPLGEAPDETEGNHPREDVLENFPSDQVRKERPERRSDQPN